MNLPATSLDRLHDLALPPAVPWWPLAPGWYVLFVLLLIIIGRLAFRTWKAWRANAYRRAALAALESAADAAAVAELLRRTALAIAPRTTVAGKQGAAWLDWLAAQSAEPMPEAVRTQLTTGVYGRPDTTADLAGLRAFAASWIKHHRPTA